MDKSGPCGSEKPTKVLRNGMDYEPKRVGPPDYTNVPNVRDWQMSPFGKERFDLDEVQKAQKKGYKFRGEYERLKKLYNIGGVADIKCEKDECEKCAERRRKELENMHGGKCTTDFIYQPYGPIIVSTVSYSRPESGVPRMYSYLGPSMISKLQYTTGNSQINQKLPCESMQMLPRNRDTRQAYIPYGPYGEIRLTSDQYVPMGPSTFSTLI